MEQSYTTVNYGSGNSKRALPHLGLCQALVTLSVLEKPLPGAGAFVKSFRSD